MTQPHFNGLLPDQAEVLAILAEECGELIQVIGKILRHGLHSAHPNGGRDNQALLEDEVGDVLAAFEMAEAVGVIFAGHTRAAMRDKLRRVGRYLHHINLPAVTP